VLSCFQIRVEKVELDAAARVTLFANGFIVRFVDANKNDQSTVLRPYNTQVNQQFLESIGNDQLPREMDTLSEDRVVAIEVTDCRAVPWIPTSNSVVPTSRSTSVTSTTTTTAITTMTTTTTTAAAAHSPQRAQAAPQSSVPLIVITKYKNGFVVSKDGCLRSYDDPKEQKFLKSIESGCD
jgi:hypothetical protein